ncbi:hypothetical protein AQUCO_00500299v1 [Aquilegia coerulea]|uniref:Photosystem I reaction center subunit V, chloroplastic n=1 Tax=Aquilegia coerulea TaxID=218851 RepID=A0A2G5ERA1_AQUCA|nr:hypothetical protein AQUCO_00500299v1 [Aquilegia coerulea]
MQVGTGPYDRIHNSNSTNVGTCKSELACNPNCCFNCFKQKLAIAYAHGRSSLRGSSNIELERAHRPTITIAATKCLSPDWFWTFGLESLDPDPLILGSGYVELTKWATTLTPLDINLIQSQTSNQSKTIRIFCLSFTTSQNKLCNPCCTKSITFLSSLTTSKKLRKSEWNQCSVIICSSEMASTGLFSTAAAFTPTTNTIQKQSHSCFHGLRPLKPTDSSFLALTSTKVRAMQPRKMNSRYVGVRADLSPSVVISLSTGLSLFLGRFVFFGFQRENVAKQGLPEQNGMTHFEAGDTRAKEYVSLLKSNDPVGFNIVDVLAWGSIGHIVAYYILATSSNGYDPKFFD